MSRACWNLRCEMVGVDLRFALALLSQADALEDGVLDVGKDLFSPPRPEFNRGSDLFQRFVECVTRHVRVTFKTGVVVEDPAILVNSILEVVAIKVGHRNSAIISAYNTQTHTALSASREKKGKSEQGVCAQELEGENSGMT